MATGQNQANSVNSNLDYLDEAKPLVDETYCNRGCIAYMKFGQWGEKSWLLGFIEIRAMGRKILAVGFHWLGGKNAGIWAKVQPNLRWIAHGSLCSIPLPLH